MAYLDILEVVLESGFGILSRQDQLLPIGMMIHPFRSASVLVALFFS